MTPSDRNRIYMQRYRERQRRGLRRLQVFLNDAAVENYVVERRPDLQHADEETLWRAAEQIAAEELKKVFECDDV